MTDHVAPATTGSTTQPSADPAHAQGPAPTTAASTTVPASNVSALPRPPARKDYTPRATFSSSLSTKPGGLSQLLSAVSETSFSSNKDLALPSFAVPNFVIFFAVLNMLDIQMARTKRFTDANPDWHPFVSQLYFAWLAHYFVLKCQQVGNALTQEQSLFLEFMENQFNVAHVKIPGPLVPIFQSLAACSGPNGRYGNVTFGIPDDLNVSQSSFFLAQSRINACLPSVIVILDQFMRLIQRLVPIGAVPGQANLAMTDMHYQDIFGVNAAANAPNRVCMKTPNARSEIEIPLSVIQGLVSSTSVWRNSLPFDSLTNDSMYTNGNNANSLNFAQYLGYQGIGNHANNNYPWFQQVARIMQPYADFFRDSCALGALSTTGIGTIYVESSFAGSDSNALMLNADLTTRNVRYMQAGTLRYAIPNLTDLSLFATYSEDELDLVAEQMGILANLNVSWIHVNGNANTTFPGPITGNIRQGPVWNRLMQKKTTYYEPLRSISTVVSGYFHVPVAGKFGN